MGASDMWLLKSLLKGTVKVDKIEGDVMTQVFDKAKAEGGFKNEYTLCPGRWPHDGKHCGMPCLIGK